MTPRARPTRGWKTFWVEPPPPGASRAETLTFIRDMQLRTLALVAIGGVLILLVTSGAVFPVLVGVSVVVSIANIASLQFKISRERGRPGR